MHQCLSSRVSLLQTWFKPQHDAWLIRGRFRVFCSLVKLALWLQQRYVKTQQITVSIRCIGNCRLLNYIFSHKNNFWCLRKPTRITPPSYPQGSVWSWWCLNRVNSRIICKVLKIDQKAMSESNRLRLVHVIVNVFTLMVPWDGPRKEMHLMLRWLWVWRMVR